MCKLAHAQAIGWALWCLWTVTALVLAYAFFLGIAAPLTSPKRISSRISSIRVNNSASITPAVPRVVRSSFTYSQVSTRAIAMLSCRFSIVDHSQFCPRQSPKLSTAAFIYPLKCVYFNKHILTKTVFIKSTCVPNN